MKILKINRKNFKKTVKEAEKYLKKGMVMIAPTDTVYGLITDATNKKAVERVFKIKKRDKGKPLPIFIKDIKMAKKLAYIDKNQEKFLKSVWPGKVTAVLKRKKNNLSENLFGGKNTIALRIPDYKFIKELLSIINVPLTGTSANISGIPASTDIEEIINQFKDKKNQPDLIINASNLKKSLPSTIIDLTSQKIKVLRK